MRHAIAQLCHRAAPFLFAHVVQPFDGLLQCRGHVLLQNRQGVAVLGCIERPGKLEHGIEIRLGADPELLGYLAEGAQISAHQVAIDSEGRAPATLQAQRDFQVSAVQALFQHAANLHLHRIELVGDAQVQVEKTVIHRF